MSEDVLALPAALGLGGADAVGHAPGGIVAYPLAQRRPGAVRRPVLEDVRAPVPLAPPRPPAERPAGELPLDSGLVPPASSRGIRSRSSPV
ncbi:hypothetical protein [Streptomyces sp. NPDC002078]